MLVPLISNTHYFLQSTTYADVNNTFNLMIVGDLEIQLQYGMQMLPVQVHPKLLFLSLMFSATFGDLV